MKYDVVLCFSSAVLTKVLFGARVWVRVRVRVRVRVVFRVRDKD